MNKENLSYFHKVFDMTMSESGFVARSQTFWRIDFQNSWYIALWLLNKGQGHTFDVNYAVGGLWDLNIDAFKTMFHRQEYSLFGLWNPGEYFRLWRHPDDYQTALQIYKEQVCGTFNKIHSVHDIYELEKRLNRDFMVTLSKGMHWIDMLLFLNREDEVAETISKMQEWIDFLYNDTLGSEQRIQEKMAQLDEMNPKIQKLLSADKQKKRYQDELDRIPERKKRIDELQEEVEDLKSLTVSQNERDKRKAQIMEKAIRNSESIIKLFSAEEIIAMGRNAANNIGEIPDD